MHFHNILGLSILFFNNIKCGKNTNVVESDAETLYNKLCSIPKYEHILKKVKRRSLYDSEDNPKESSGQYDIDFSFQRLIDAITRIKTPWIEEIMIFITLKDETYALEKQIKRYLRETFLAENPKFITIYERALLDLPREFIRVIFTLVSNIAGENKPIKFGIKKAFLLTNVFIRKYYNFITKLYLIETQQLAIISLKYREITITSDAKGHLLDLFEEYLKKLEPIFLNVKLINYYSHKEEMRINLIDVKNEIQRTIRYSNKWIGSSMRCKKKDLKEYGKYSISYDQTLIFLELVYKKKPTDLQTSIYEPFLSSNYQIAFEDLTYDDQDDGVFINCLNIEKYATNRVNVYDILEDSSDERKEELSPDINQPETPKSDDVEWYFPEKPHKDVKPERQVKQVKFN